MESVPFLNGYLIFWDLSVDNPAFLTVTNPYPHSSGFSVCTMVPRAVHLSSSSLTPVLRHRELSQGCELWGWMDS